jgi:hypothetical protein
MEEELDLDDPTDLHNNVSGESHDQSSPAAQQELENGRQPSKYTFIEDAADSEGEQAGGHPRIRRISTQLITATATVIRLLVQVANPQDCLPRRQ